MSDMVYDLGGLVVLAGLCFPFGSCFIAGYWRIHTTFHMGIRHKVVMRAGA